jgi:hypothetical protein
MEPSSQFLAHLEQLQTKVQMLQTCQYSRHSLEEVVNSVRGYVVQYNLDHYPLMQLLDDEVSKHLYYEI